MVVVVVVAKIRRRPSLPVSSRSIPESPRFSGSLTRSVLPKTRPSSVRSCKFEIEKSFFFFFWYLLRIDSNLMVDLRYRHKTRLHIGQLVKDTSAKLKEASETDHRSGVNVKSQSFFFVFVFFWFCWSLMMMMMVVDCLL